MEANMKQLSIINENSDQTNFRSNLEIADIKIQKDEFISTNDRDPFEPVDSNEKSTVFQASINLFKTYVGGGILALPYIFYKTGFVLATFALILTASLVFYSTLLLMELIKDSGNKPVQVTELFNRTMGRKASMIYKFLLINFQLGICISYAIFFTDFFQIAFQTQESPSTRIIFACLSLIIILPLSMINSYSFFVKFSNLANILIFITLIAILQLAFSELYSNELVSNEQNLGHITHLPSFIGVSIFAFECIGSIFPVRNSMKEPEKFPKVFCFISLIVCVIYILFSVICAASLGHKLNQIVLMDLEKIQSFFYIFQTMYAIALILSYPLQFYPIVILIEDSAYFKKIVLEKHYKLKTYSVRIMLTLIIFALSFAIPKFASFINLVGAFAGINIQFVFPIIAYHNTFKLVAPKWKIYLNIGVLVLGVIGSGFGIYDSIKEMSEK